jgi:hypothetical protein
MIRWTLTDEEVVNVEQLQTKLTQMTDSELLHFRQAAEYMCSKHANMGKPPRQCFVVQLHEAQIEWRKRHPKKT